MSIKKHVLTHNREMPFKYEECAPGFSRNSTLKIHMKSHTWHKPISVSIDERGFSVCVRLKKHISTNTGEKKEKRRCKCEECWVDY